MMADAGVKVTLNSVVGKDYDNAREGGKHDWYIRRNDQEFVLVVQGISRLALTGPETATWHYGNTKGELDLLPYEQKLVDDISAFNSMQDATSRADAMKDYSKMSRPSV